MPEKTKRIEVFFSYSHRDEKLRNELSKHLAILKRQHVIDEWHDRKIGAVKEWKDAIDTHLKSADIMLLLISSDFMASDYCYGVEMKRALERHDEGKVRVIPIILRPVQWKDAPFGKLQALPKNAKPVTKWSNRDAAFQNIAEGISTGVEELLAGRYKKPVHALRRKQRITSHVQPKIEKKKTIALKPEPSKISKAKKATPKQKIAKKKPIARSKPASKNKTKKPVVTKVEPKAISIILRSTPTTLSEAQKNAMLVEKGFYDKQQNESGRGIIHNYVAQTLNGDKVVLDKTTGLMWQQSGSSHDITYIDAEKYIRGLNNRPAGFAGYKDWCLPTLEEAMSLMEPVKKNSGVYIDPVFDETQRWIWTADKYRASSAWSVSLDYGLCYSDDVNLNCYVRAVR